MHQATGADDVSIIDKVLCQELGLTSTKNVSHNSCLHGVYGGSINANSNKQDSHSNWWRRKRNICLCHSVREATEEEAVAGVTCCTSVYVTVSGSHRGGGYRRGSLLYICLYTQYQGSHRGGG